MPASTTVPGFLAGYQTLLDARPALAGVAVRIGGFAFTDPEAIVLVEALMAGAAFLGWGASADSLATTEPLTLTAYAYARLGGDYNDPAAVNAALARVEVLYVEAVQQLRDDPTLAGELVAPRRLTPPMVTSARWRVLPADAGGIAVTRAQVDFTVAWQAISA